MDENIESLRNLEENLNEHGLTLDTIPWVIQYNKRDLPDALPAEVMASKLNLLNVPSFQATATTGEGIYESFQAIAGMLYGQLVERLKNAQPAHRPVEEEGVSEAPAPTPGSPADPALGSMDDADSVTDVLDTALREVDSEAAPRRTAPTQTPPAAPRKSKEPAKARTPKASQAGQSVTHATDDSLDKEFQFASLEGGGSDDKDVGRTIEFEDTQSLEKSDQPDGEFIVNPFQSSKAKKKKPAPPPTPSESAPEPRGESVRVATQKPPPPAAASPPKPPPPAAASPPKPPSPPAAASPPKPPSPPAAAPPPKPSSEPIATDDAVTVTVPVFLSKSQTRKTVPIKVELEIHLTDEEA
jgi:hypothetical protein